MRSITILIALCILVLPAGLSPLASIPSATASHGLVHDSAVDDSVRRTSEPDDAVFRCTGCALDGRANRVTAPARTPGDGGLFLDMKLGSRVGPDSGPGFDLYAGAFLAPATTGRPILLPGMSHATAWYGEWSDLDNDGVIDDVHDADPNGAFDEFRWRGVASSDTVAMTYYVNPYPFFYVHGPGSERSLDENVMLDQTGLSNPSQEWADQFSSPSADAGYLAEIRVLTLAGAPRVTGSAIDYDIDHPDALIDVDIYQAVSPDVGSLWTSTARAGVTAYQAGLALAIAALGDAQAVYNPILDVFVDPTLDEALALATDPTLAIDRVSPKDRREPNTWEDDFEGRALFGGVGDVPGSYNLYPGHQDGFHMWFDARPTFIACGGAWADAGVATLDAKAPACVRRSLDPAAQQLNGEGSSGAILSFNADIFLWFDKNHDGMAGPSCDPADPDEFDQERNTCADRFHATDAYPFYGSNTEKVSACSVATARGSSLAVKPTDEDWPVGTLLVPDFKQTTRPVLSTSLRVLSGQETAMVRWEDACDGTSDLLSRDAIVFPAGGTFVALRVETTASIDSFVDQTRGIANGRESVTDVDVIPPLL